MTITDYKLLQFIASFTLALVATSANVLIAVVFAVIITLCAFAFFLSNSLEFRSKKINLKKATTIFGITTASYVVAIFFGGSLLLDQDNTITILLLIVFLSVSDAQDASVNCIETYVLYITFALNTLFWSTPNPDSTVIFTLIVTVVVFSLPEKMLNLPEADKIAAIMVSQAIWALAYSGNHSLYGLAFLCFGSIVLLTSSFCLTRKNHVIPFLSVSSPFLAICIFYQII